MQKSLLEQEKKVCKLCKEQKILIQFPKIYKSQNRRGYCSHCMYLRYGKRKLEDPKYREYIKNYYKGKWRQYRYSSKYNLTYEQYNIIFRTQNGVCAICSNSENVLANRKTGKMRPLSVDHSHETGKIRGLLCHFCNIGIGTFRDDVDLLKKAIDYLNSRGR